MAISTSSTPRFFSSFMTRSQNLAPSVCSIQRPRISFVPSGADAERDIDRLVADRPLVAHLDPDRIEEDQRIEGFQRPVLPVRHLVQDGVGDGADQVGRDVDPVELTQMPLDLADAHAAGVHRDDLLVEAGKPPLVLGDQLRIEGRQPIPRNLEVDLAGLGQHRLLAIAVAAVGPAVRLAGLQVMIHLRVQRPLGQRLLQLVQQAVLLERRLRIRAGQQLVQKLIGNNRLFASCHTMSPSPHRHGPYTKFPTLPPATGESRRIVPTIVFHADKDSTVHPRNGDQVIAQSGAAGGLRTEVQRGQVPGGHAYSRTIHADADGQPVLEQ